MINDDVFKDGSASLRSRNHSCYKIMIIIAKSPPIFVNYRPRDIFGSMPVATREGGSKLVGSDRNQRGRLIIFSMLTCLFRSLGLYNWQTFGVVIVENFAKKVRNWVLYFQSINQKMRAAEDLWALQQSAELWVGKNSWNDIWGRVFENGVSRKYIGMI